MLAIYKKELKGFFTSMLGWLFLSANLFFAGWYFRYYGMIAGLPYISYVINGIMLIFLFSIPILTMRSFSEEMRAKTDQLLYTAPVQIWKIVIGKYLALITVLGIVIAAIGLYPLFQMIFGSVPVAENYMALFGFFLFGAACIAIGLMISCFTESQIISAVLSFFVLLVGAMIPGISNLISVNGNIFTRILKVFDITSSLDAYLDGKVYITSFLYYVSIIAVCLMVAIFINEKRRWNFGSKGWLAGLKQVLSLVVFVLVVIAINVAASMLPEEAVLSDVTYNRLYSLTDETKSILDGLENDVYIYYLADSTTVDEVVENTLSCIDEYSRKVTVQRISPTDNPYFYTQYTEQNPTDNSMIVVCGDKYKIVNYYDCYTIAYEYQYDADSAQYVISEYKVTGYDGEGRIMGAIRNVSKDEKPKIYCITGHNEIELGDASSGSSVSGLRAKLEKQNYVVESINLLTYDTIPDDAACIFIYGPLKDYSDSEKSKISAYLKNGGNALIVIAYSDSNELNNFYSILEPYNIAVHPGLVMEQGTSFYNSQQYYLLPEIIDTDVTKGIYSYMRNNYIYMPYAKGLEINDTYADAHTEVLLQTTENAYCLTDVTGSTDVDEYDVGRYALGVLAEKNYSDRTSKIAVFTSDYFLNDEVDAGVAGNNQLLFINCLNKINGTTDDSIVPVKSYYYDPIMFNDFFVTVVSIFLIVIVPLGILFAGIYFWYSRKIA